MWYCSDYGPNLWEWVTVTAPRSEPEEIRVLRYAVGEINEAELVRRQAVLQGDSDHAGDVR